MWLTGAIVNNHGSLTTISDNAHNNGRRHFSTYLYKYTGYHIPKMGQINTHAIPLLSYKPIKCISTELPRQYYINAIIPRYSVNNSAIILVKFLKCFK